MSAGTRRYYRGRDLVAMRDVAGAATRYYHFDNLGTTQCLTDQAGAVTDRFACDAWGVPVKRTGTSVNRQWYVGNLGYYRQVDRVLDYVRARYGEPLAARWLSLDPALRIRGGFQYATNRPSSLTDGTGLRPSAASCPTPGGCCDRFTLARVQTDEGDKCKDGTWTECPPFGANNQAKLKQQCLVGGAAANCAALGLGIFASASDCYDSCQNNTVPQSKLGFQAAAYTPCCINVTISEGTSTPKCTVCGYYCCSVNEPQSACLLYCEYVHEATHGKQCSDGLCNENPPGVPDKARAAKSECGAYWTDLQCQLDFYKQLKCPALPTSTTGKVASCNAAHARVWPSKPPRV